jgi:hypothetical protein
VKVGKLAKNPGLAIAYDPAERLYYSLVAQNAWPSTVLVYKGTTGYEAWAFELARAARLEEGAGLACRARNCLWELVQLQRKRYFLEAGITSTRLSTEYMVRELLMQSQKEEDSDVKKKLKNKRSKLSSRLGKLREESLDEMLPLFLKEHD